MIWKLNFGLVINGEPRRSEDFYFENVEHAMSFVMHQSHLDITDINLTKHYINSWDKPYVLNAEPVEPCDTEEPAFIFEDEEEN